MASSTARASERATGRDKRAKPLEFGRQTAAHDGAFAAY